MSDMFQFVKRPYNFRNSSILHRKRTQTVYNGSETLSSLTAKICELTLTSLKEKA